MAVSRAISWFASSVKKLRQWQFVECSSQLHLSAAKERINSKHLCSAAVLSKSFCFGWMERMMCGMMMLCGRTLFFDVNDQSSFLTTYYKKTSKRTITYVRNSDKLGTHASEDAIFFIIGASHMEVQISNYHNYLTTQLYLTSGISTESVSFWLS